MITFNGRPVNENILSVRAERRRTRALLDPGVEAGLNLDLAKLPVDLDALTESNLLFRLSVIYSTLGASLEPPLAYDKDLSRERLTGLRNIYRKTVRRVITSSGEGYLEQQEELNALYMRGLSAAERLIDQRLGLPGSPRQLPDRICFRPLRAWEPELVDAVASLGGGPVLMLTIPGAEMLEAFENAGRPCLAVGDRDLEVALCQERCLRARLADPLAFLRAAPSGSALAEYGLVLVGVPEFLQAPDLFELIRLAARGMHPRAVLAVRVYPNDGSAEGPEQSEPGFQRFYTSDFVNRLMEQAGFEIAASGPPMAVGRLKKEAAPEAVPEPPQATQPEPPAEPEPLQEPEREAADPEPESEVEAGTDTGDADDAGEVHA